MHDTWIWCKKGILINTFHKDDIMFVVLQNTIADSWFQELTDI